jgi:PAS domain S-box-containing protein
MAGVLWLGGTHGLAAQEAGAKKRAMERVTLQLKWRHQFQFAGYYAAIEQGYYREAGLEVVLREAEPGKDPVEAVLRGEAEFGVGTSELMLLRAKGEPVVVLAAVFQHSPLVLITLGGGAEVDLQAVHDRPMMVEPQSAELFAYFKNEGIDPARLKVVHHTFSVADLLSGKVGAMTGYLSDEPFLLQRAGVAFSVFSPRAGGIDFYGDNLFTTEAHIRENEARVKAFREASLRGWEYALAHPAEIVELIVTRYHSVKSREHLLFEAERTIQLMHPGLIEVGHMNPGRWRHIADTYAEFGMVPKEFPVGEMIYNADSKPDLRGWYWALGIAGALTVAALGWVAPLVRLNRRLRRGERQYRELADNAPFPVVISDLESGRIVFANRLAADMFGERPENLFNRLAVGFYARPEDRARLLDDLREGLAVPPREICFRDRRGREIWTLLSAGRVEFDGHAAVAVAFHDITARRALEEELRQAKDCAESANLERNRYLAVMSHEIRTPMNGIRGLAEMMLEENRTLDAEHRESLRMMRTAADSLTQLVNELLDWSQLESGAVAIDASQVLLADFLRHLAGLFRPATEARGVELRLEIAPEVPPIIVTDPLRLRQILSNLLSNAAKFTAQGSVTLEVRSGGGEPDAEGKVRICFLVTDTGPGIPAAVQPKLFAPFVQADASVARRYGGSGLGLSISQGLARLLGGGITLESEERRGSVFTVEIAAGLPDEAG